MIFIKTIIKKRIYEKTYYGFTHNANYFDYNDIRPFIRESDEIFLREEIVYECNGFIQLMVGNKFDTGKEILLLEEVVQSENDIIGYSREIDEGKSLVNLYEVKDKLTKSIEIEKETQRREDIIYKQKIEKPKGLRKLFKI